MKSKKSVIYYLKLAHWVGLLAVSLGTSIYYYTDIGNAVTGIMIIASLIGGGLVLMSPFPIALFMQWAQKQ